MVFRPDVRLAASQASGSTVSDGASDAWNSSRRNQSQASLNRGSAAFSSATISDRTPSSFLSVSQGATVGLRPVARPMTFSPKAWKVVASTPSAGRPAAANRVWMRVWSSVAASLLKASSTISSGLASSRDTAYAARDTMTDVLPDPAAAMTFTRLS